MSLNSYMLKEQARENLQGNWGVAIIICLVVFIIQLVLSFIPFSGPIISMIICGPIILGLTNSFLKISRKETLEFECVFSGFKNFKNSFLLGLLLGIATLLWTLLFIIPGIIAAYRYSMAFYILADNPEIGIMEAIVRSCEIMDGYKWRLFCLHVSFIGWAILGALTFGIGYVFLMPYIKASVAEFYEVLKKE